MKKAVLALSIAAIAASVYAFDSEASITTKGTVGSYTKTEYSVTQKFGDWAAGSTIARVTKVLIISHMKDGGMISSSLTGESILLFMVISEARQPSTYPLQRSMAHLRLLTATAPALDQQCIESLHTQPDILRIIFSHVPGQQASPGTVKRLAMISAAVRC